MDWNELLRGIEKMTPAQRRQEVRFVEPYDEERAGYHLDLSYAQEDITIGGGSQPWDEPERVFLIRGEPYLA